MVQSESLEEAISWMNANAERFVRADDIAATLCEIRAKYAVLYLLSPSTPQPLGAMFAAYAGSISGLYLKERCAKINVE